MIIFICFILILIVALYLYTKISYRDRISPQVNLNITSEAFEDGGIMPIKYTGRGENVSPPLKLEGIDPQAKTIAIIMDDLDHPLGIFNHWVLWNIPCSIDYIPQAVPKTEVVPSLGNAIQGKSQYGGKHWYRGPLPPFGSHKYIFKVYVLDIALDLKPSNGKRHLEQAMDGHILQYGILTGNFGSKG